MSETMENYDEKVTYSGFIGHVMVDPTIVG